MVGILVHGDNHFIVRGLLPDQEVPLALIRHTGPLSRSGRQRRLRSIDGHISHQEFRENLEWAVVVPGDSEISRYLRQ